MKFQPVLCVGMKPLSERDENTNKSPMKFQPVLCVGMKPLSERDENYWPYAWIISENLNQ